MNYSINHRDFIHETDKKALDSLKAIPGFDQLTKAFMKVFSERTMKILNMSSKVRLSPEQCPRIYNLLVPICEKFEIPVPELYLELDRDPNAYTSGDTTIYITITSGLLELFTDEQIQTVLAHECGHIVCHHVLYHTMGRLILSGAAYVLGLGQLVTTALSVAFSYWMRCSEFSCDRAAAVFCGGPDRVVDVMMGLAGGTNSQENEIYAELFVEQAKEYEAYVDDSNWNKILEAVTLMDVTHPFLAVRVAHIKKWCQEPNFKRIVTGITPALASGHCPKCGTQVDHSWAFCRKCGNQLK